MMGLYARLWIGFPFSEARKAYDKGASGNVHGKILVKVANEMLR